MATLATNVSFQCLGFDGKPLAGGKIYTYAAGTTTPKTTYTTMAGTVANPNPVILDQNGKAKIFLGDGAYRLQILDSNNAIVDDIDQISRYVTQSEFASFQQTVSDGVLQLTEIKEQIDVYVDTALGNQKGYAGGVAPLDENVQIDPVYFPELPHTGVPQATETQIGVAEIATQAETNTATDDLRTVTPKKLLAGVKNHLNASGDAPMHACRAWVNFNGTGTVSIRASGNVSSITDNGVGDYTVNLTTAMPDANYVWDGTVQGDAVGFARSAFSNTADVNTTTSFKVKTGYSSGGSSALQDFPTVSVTVFR
ncbi:hypothetical protein [Acinetobacter sp. ANC 4173]|uniref:hypothetical protein n=1 Tax=Acinetobacter sp. ANC 4173 TaxID=2529837 RepID=UPI00103C251C|nr:hypothetical protein [Acinetobacter sp. ANC 4173]TCB77428.1 hypothetical protein E0H94_14640 [Acinetobacter sp. ANC 4173]